MAAARKVSPATSNTFLPSLRYWAANLPMVVVLPTPLTPRKITTQGRTESRARLGAATEPRSMSTMAACSWADMSWLRSSLLPGA